MGYLKALGVFRVVAEQKDPGADLSWTDEGPVLRSALQAAALVEFFLKEYCPTPIIAPWNAGSGFFKKGVADKVLERLESATDQRFQDYALAIRAGREALDAVGAGGRILPGKGPEKRRKRAAGAAKTQLISECRARLPERALAALDAMVVLGEQRVLYAPLMGSGGNDGNFEFTNNFMQRLLEVLPTRDGEPLPKGSQQWLLRALFAEGNPSLRPATVGQFSPGGMGGPNAARGFEGRSVVNPWDYVLAIEGCAFIVGAASRRLRAGAGGTASFPFTVRVSGPAMGSVGEGEVAAARGEIWLPVWQRPASYAEVRYLFGEARAETGRRMASTGVDFARAVAALGVDRGLEAFRRFAFLGGQRSGRMHLTVDLGRLRVVPRPETGVLRQLDVWLGRLRQAAEEGPLSLQRAVRKIDDAILLFCKHGGAAHLQAVIAALGGAERVLAKGHARIGGAGDRSEGVRAGREGADSLPPLHGLDAARWLPAADDGSAEFRLAAALASVTDEIIGPLRCQLEPVTMASGRLTWAGSTRTDDAARLWPRKPVWGSGRLPLNLAACLERRCIEAERAGAETVPLDALLYPGLSSVLAYLEGRIDEQRVEDLLWGLLGLQWRGAPKRLWASGSTAETKSALSTLPRAYALLKLLFLPFPIQHSGQRQADVPRKGRVQVLSYLRAGRFEDAIGVAWARLRAAGFALRGWHGRARPDFTLSGPEQQRLAGALLVPVSPEEAGWMARLVLVEGEEEIS